MIKRRNIDPNYLPSVMSGNTMYVQMPASNAIGLRTAAAVTALGNATLDGAAVNLVGGRYYLPMPTFLGFTTGLNATTFTAVVTGYDYQDNLVTGTVQKTATGTTEQLEQTGYVWRSITSINITACNNLADTLSIGWYYRLSSASGGAIRIPCHLRFPSTSITDLALVSLIDAGGGTFAVSKWTVGGAGGVLVSGVNATWAAGPAITVSTPQCSVQPTSAITFALQFVGDFIRPTY